jgi:hypothetical protein
MALSQDEEGVPLTGSKSNANASSRFRLLQRFVGVIAIVGAICLLVVLREKSKEESSAPTEQKGHSRAKIPPGQCPKFCEARLAQRVYHQGGDLLQPPDLLNAATRAREQMVLTLKGQYGEDVYKAMFEDPDGTSRGIKTFWGAGDTAEIEGPSKARFRRKLKIKLLEVQRAIREGESHVSGCDCMGKKGRRLQDPNAVVLPELPFSYSMFVWATGGHSAAAGHGNLYNESYTAFMETAAKDVFKAVGIDFVGRNYAMGGMSSAPEIALCQESLFGIDADVISWDFGMTDGGTYWKKLLYSNRIGMHRNKPAAVDINIAGRQFNGRLDQLKRVEEQGVSALFMHPDKWKDIEKGIPDMFGMSNEDMAKIAPYSRDFKCKDTLEKGDPTCGANKYNDALCADRKHKASWHPGWRVNAAYGSIMALFMTDMLLEAIKDLGTEPYIPLELMSDLLDEEAVEHAKFYESTPEITEALVKDVMDFTDKPLMELTTKMFRKTNVICHTALLPSQSRFLGIVTESDKIGPHDFEKGISQQQADADKPSDEEKDKRQMRLTFDPAERSAPSCPVDVKWDYKDFFYSTQNDGWTTLTVPNDAEKAYYLARDGVYEPEGGILLCFFKCDWGKCPEGDMQFDHLAEGKLKLEVNGVAVTNVTRIQECGMLRHGDGDYHFKPNSDGRFELRALVGQAEQGKRASYARITSMVVI